MISFFALLCEIKFATTGWSFERSCVGSSSDDVIDVEYISPDSVNTLILYL